MEDTKLCTDSSKYKAFSKPEVDLRNAYRDKVGITQLEALSDAFLKPADENIKYDAVRKHLHTKISNEQTSISKELAELRGPNKNDGTVDKAYKVLVAAETARNTAAEALRTAAMATPFGGVTPATTIDVLLLLTIDFPEVTAAKAALLTKQGEFLAAQKEFTKLENRLKHLAVFKDKTVEIEGGKFDENRKKLQDDNLQVATVVEATKIGNFYKALSMETPEPFDVKNVPIDQYNQAFHNMLFN
jgi:hypothetical protein